MHNVFQDLQLQFVFTISQCYFESTGGLLNMCDVRKWSFMNKTQGVAHLPRGAISFNNGFQHSIRSISFTLDACICPAGTTCTQDHEILINQSWLQLLTSVIRSPAIFFIHHLCGLNLTSNSLIYPFYLFLPIKKYSLFFRKRLFVVRLHRKISIITQYMNNSKNNALTKCICYKINYLTNFYENLSRVKALNADQALILNHILYLNNIL